MLFRSLSNAGALANTNSYIASRPYFGRVVIGTASIIATTPNTSFALAAGNNVTLSACTTTRVVTISSSGGGGGATTGGFNNSTMTSFPGITGDYDYGDGETYPGSQGVTQDAFGVPVGGQNYDCMDPTGTLLSAIDLGSNVSI